MKHSQGRGVLVAKVVVAAVLFPALIWLVGANGSPSLPLSRLLPWMLVGALAILGLLVPVIVISLALGQFALNRGGTDPQWFWFPSEPRGLVRLREELAAQEKLPTTGHRSP